ncbi:hypothetical protein A1O3_08389 [Capronia epimyces CBS 606.96]|uniref:BRCT domain-containing protein n=1 Tax=Capronia epimyces CBS 606.96 TaxID=1182542 RepID=W9XIQ5_9EURO|nr:uncharacterized protein A1O3_08389 [Capronia epimyces CBS 606.96]EXJ80103.1 hypothetical protein A1O3_08389 [Capronia epimyces CBS 606.96]
MGKTFRNICVVSTNDFPTDKNEKIKGWIEHNGGTFCKEISKDVTHLLASQKAWKRYHPLVREARQYRTIRIVQLEWLEDSLLSKSKRPLDTIKYEFEPRRVTKTVRKRKAVTEEDTRGKSEQGIESQSMTLETRGPRDTLEKATGKRQSKKRKVVRKNKANMAGMKQEKSILNKDERIEIAGKEFDAACAEFEKDMAVSGYRPFIDSNGFVFLVTLVRKDILRNQLEKHRLKVRYAPYFASHRHTFYPILPENPDRRRKVSDDVVSPDRCAQYLSSGSSGDDAFAEFGPRLLKASLPPCPVPLCYFPKPYPYSRYPAVASSLPRYLKPSNPALRVHIPDPWAQGLQLFEHDPAVAKTPTEDSTPTKPKQPRFKSYACYFIYTRPGQRHVQMLAPPGSTFDFAWDMFRKFFKRRVGVDWEDRESAKRRLQMADAQDGKIGGEDGANERRWDFWGPLVASWGGNDDPVEPAPSVEGRERRPSVTVVMNTTELTATEAIDAKAKTPPAGW